MHFIHKFTNKLSQLESFTDQGMSNSSLSCRWVISLRLALRLGTNSFITYLSFGCAFACACLSFVGRAGLMWSLANEYYHICKYTYSKQILQS